MIFYRERHKNRLYLFLSFIGFLSALIATFLYLSGNADILSFKSFNNKSVSTGFFIKKDAAKKVGDYNIKYKYSADYDYFYRMIVKHKLKGVATKKNEVLGIFRRGGFSSKVNFFDHLSECTKIRIDNGQNKFVVLLTFLLKYLYNINKIK